MAKKSEKQLKVAYYLRVSTEDQAEKYGIALQKDALDSLIKAKGKLSDGSEAMVLAGDEYIYVDDGVSGTVPLQERPAFARLIEDMAFNEQAPFDIVATYKIDRFARKLKILLEVIDTFEKYSVQFISATEMIDTSTPFGKAVLGMVGVMAELELETIKDRTHKGRKSAIKRGVYMGGVEPFGYVKDEEKKLVILEEEAEVVRLIFDLVVNERLSVYGVTQYLIDNGYPTPEVFAVKLGKKKTLRKKEKPTFWKSGVVRKILQNDIYTGRYYYNKMQGKIQQPKEKWLLSPYQYTPIINDFTFGKAQEILSEDRYRKKAVKKDEHIYLLSGLMKCDCCYDPVVDTSRMTLSGNRKLVKIKTGRKYTYNYRCNGKNPSKSTKKCKAVPLPADEIETYVGNLFKAILENPETIYNYQDKLESSKLKLKQLTQRKNDLIKLKNDLPLRKERLNDLYTEGHLKKADYEKRVQEIDKNEKLYEEKLLEIETELAQNTMTQGYIKSFDIFKKLHGKALDDIFSNRQDTADLFHMLIEKVVVRTRPLKAGEKVSGRPVGAQEIPNKVDIVFRLPQEYLEELYLKLQKNDFDPKALIWWDRNIYPELFPREKFPLVLTLVDMDSVIVRTGKRY